MKASSSNEYEEEEIFDEEEEMDSDASESSGEYDDDGEEEPPTQAAFNALLKRWLNAENQSHLHRKMQVPVLSTPFPYYPRVTFRLLTPWGYL